MTGVSIPIVGCNWLFDGNTMMVSIEVYWVIPYDPNLTSINMACDWWCSSIEACLLISLSRFGMMFNLNVLTIWLWDLWLTWNDIRFVMKYLCTFLRHVDYVMLILHMRVAMKGYVHAIPNELMRMIIQWFWPYDLY